MGLVLSTVNLPEGTGEWLKKSQNDRKFEKKINKKPQEHCKMIFVFLPSPGQARVGSDSIGLVSPSRYKQLCNFAPRPAESSWSVVAKNPPNFTLNSLSWQLKPFSRIKRHHFCVGNSWFAPAAKLWKCLVFSFSRTFV